MTREDIIRMAREAGFDDFFCRDLMLERFAALVAEHERAAEREACARVAENGLTIASSMTALDDMEMWGEKFAAAIRARGSK
jgi:hypothetical protein